MNELQRALSSITTQLYANALLRTLLLGVSALLVVAAFAGFSVWAIGAGIIGLSVGAWLTGLYRSQKPLAVQLIHQTVGDAEYSLPLLNKPNLNLAEQLQLDRLSSRIQHVSVPGVLWRGAGWYALALLLALGVYAGYPLLQQPDAKLPQIAGLALVQSEPDTPPAPPVFKSASVQIQPPAYTKLPTRRTNDLNVVSLVGSMLKWQVQFSHSKNLSVRLVNSRGKELPFQTSEHIFLYQDKLLTSGLYAIKAYWKRPGKPDSVVYQSDFYRLEAQPDLAPKIDPASKELYTYHFLKDPKKLSISAKISDDFLVSKAFIVATVARGSGESVKFREIRLPLSPANFREATLSKTLDLNALQFAPGDELYYYWAAFDNRQPAPNFTKSDTYFVVYKDTTQLEESELATMAVNIMPEYFRSQRQIIIDTEKLIAGRKRQPAQVFKSQSNEIGFDQKVLRLRYGQFLGEEFESSAGGGHIEPTDDHDDPLAGFRHDHDTGKGDDHEMEHKEEHHDHDHGNSGPSNDQDPVAALMEQYVHAHDNAETNTFHEQSTRSLLKMALEQMWQSELHLRLYEPEKALPFEQKALEYLKLSQQKARSYVKKTGFDPPAIKEKEVRLTGELKNVDAANRQTRNLMQVRTEQLVTEVMGYLNLPKLNASQRQTVQQLGNALTSRALNSGLTNWSVLASLQKLVSGKPLSVAEKATLKTKLLTLAGPQNQTAPPITANPRLEQAFWGNM